MNGSPGPRRGRLHAIVKDPCSDWFIGLCERDDVLARRDRVLLPFGPCIGGGEGEQFVGFDAEDVAEGCQELE